MNTTSKRLLRDIGNTALFPRPPFANSRRYAEQLKQNCLRVSQTSRRLKKTKLHYCSNHTVRTTDMKNFLRVHCVNADDTVQVSEVSQEDGHLGPVKHCPVKCGVKIRAPYCYTLSPRRKAQREGATSDEAGRKGRSKFRPKAPPMTGNGNR